MQRTAEHRLRHLWQPAAPGRRPARAQELCCGDVAQLRQDYAAAVPGAWVQSGALQAALQQLGGAGAMQPRPIDVARFLHLRQEDLRLGDVRGLHEAFQTASALRTG